LQLWITLGAVLWTRPRLGLRLVLEAARSTALDAFTKSDSPCLVWTTTTWDGHRASGRAGQPSGHAPSQFGRPAMVHDDKDVVPHFEPLSHFILSAPLAR
jgi:hypothetical protein